MRSGCECAAAWLRTADGRLISAAALSPEGAAIAPDLLAFEACAEIGRAFDLGRLDAGRISDVRAREALERLARDHSLCAARIVFGAEGRAHALLLIGAGPNDALASVRPRTLALLDEEAARVGAESSGALANSSELALRPEVQRIDRLASLGSLVGELVHEVRNPLAAVKTFLQLLPEHLDDEEFTGNYRDVVCDEVARIERLLAAFGQQAQAARREAPGAAPTDNDAAEMTNLPLSAIEPIANEIASLLAMSARERGIDLAVEIPATLAPAAIAPDELRQIILNLSMNAIDATPIHGAVRLRAEASRGGVVIFVDDSGPGVAEAQRTLVFEPFHTTRTGAPGGLGLAIARRIAERAGGSIEIGQAPEGGARFQLRLPAAETELAARLIGDA